MRKLLPLIILTIVFIFGSCVEYGTPDLTTPLKAGLSANCNFTDLVPDLEIPTPDYPGYEGEDVPIDIDKDGTDDFAIRYYRYSGNYGSSRSFYIKALNTDAMISVIETDTKVYDIDEVLLCDDNYSSDSFVLYDMEFVYAHASDSGEDETTETGLWKDIDRRCIAFKFLVAGEWRLGWIKIGLVEENRKLIVYEYAYGKEAGC